MTRRKRRQGNTLKLVGHLIWHIQQKATRYPISKQSWSKDRHPSLSSDLCLWAMIRASLHSLLHVSHTPPPTHIKAIRKKNIWWKPKRYLDHTLFAVWIIFLGYLIVHNISSLLWISMSDFKALRYNWHLCNSKKARLNVQYWIIVCSFVANSV